MSRELTSRSRRLERTQYAPYRIIIARDHSAGERARLLRFPDQDRDRVHSREVGFSRVPLFQDRAHVLRRRPIVA